MKKEITQGHSGSGDNVGRDKNTYVKLPKYYILLISTIILTIPILLWLGLFDWENKIDSENELVIKGKWNPELANKILLDSMEAYHNDGPFGTRYSIDAITTYGEDPDFKLLHKIINQYWLDLGEKQSFFVVGYTGFDFEKFSSCHQCGAPLSIFEFQKVDGGYRLLNKYINIQIEDGEWGKPPREVNISNIGHDLFGIETREYFRTSGNNLGLEIVSLYAILGDNFEKIFSTCIYAKDHNFDNEYYFANLEFIKNGTGYYDLKKIIKEIPKLNPFERDTIKEVNYIERYSFNGKEYLLKNPVNNDRED